MTMSIKLQRGFTAVELVAVLIVVGILSATVVPRLYSTNTFQLQAIRDQFVSAAFLAQQLAMARADATTAVTFVSTANSFKVTVGGSTATVGSENFDISLPSGYSLSPAVTLGYDRLGRTTKTAYTLSGDGGTVSITVEATGYAY